MNAATVAIHGRTLFRRGSACLCNGPPAAMRAAHRVLLGILLLGLSGQTVAGGATRLDDGAPLCPATCQNGKGDARRHLIVADCGPFSFRPSRFRSTEDPFQDHYVRYDQDRFGAIQRMPALQGLGECRMSGSSQFRLGRSLHWLRELRKRYPRLVVVDLRLESHGFLDDLAVNYFCPTNWDRLPAGPSGDHLPIDGEALDAAEEDEFGALQVVGRANVLAPIDRNSYSEHRFEAKHVVFQKSLTEREAVEAMGISYERIHIPDHQRPRDDQVERLVALLSPAREPHAAAGSSAPWFHFHCKAGVGRTTTVMVMRDMLLNAAEVAFDDILNRNHILANFSLSNMRHYRGTFKMRPAVARRRFIKDFYHYSQQRTARHREGGGWLTWGEYVRQKAAPPDGARSGPPSS